MSIHTRCPHCFNLEYKYLSKESLPRQEEKCYNKYMKEGAV